MSKSTKKQKKPQTKHSSEDEISTSDDELAEFVNKTITEETPDLNESLHDQPELQDLAKLLLDTITESTKTPMSPKKAQNVELALNYLISEVSPETANDKDSDTSKTFVDYTSLLAQNPSDINIARLQITELRRKLAQNEQELAKAKKEVKTAQSETDKALKKNAQLTREKNETENKHLQEVQKLNARIQDLESQIQENGDKGRRGDETVESLKRRLRQSEIEIEADKREIEEMKAKLTKQSRKINKLRQMLKMGDIKYEELQLSKTESEMNLSSIFMNQSRIRDEKTKSCVTKLIKFTKQQGEQLAAVIKANHRAADVIARLSQLTEEYEDRMQLYEADLAELKEQVYEANNKSVEVDDRSDELKGLLESRTEELTELRDIITKCVDAAAPRHMITPEQIPDLISDLQDGGVSEEQEEQLERLNALADGLTRFTLTLIRNNYADTNLLEKRAEPIISDGSIRLDVLNQIVGIRDYLDTISYKTAEEDPALAYLAGITDHVDLKDTAEVGASVVLADICGLLKDKMKKDMDELAKVKEVLPFVCDDSELPAAVSQYLLELQPVFQQLLDVLSKTLKFHGTTEDIFQMLCKYVEETSNMMEELDETVRPLIGFSGKITDMPKLIVEALVTMKQDLDNYRKGISRDLTNTVIAADKEKSQFKRQIHDLNEAVERNQGIIDTLQSQLDQTTTQLQETQTSCTDINGKRNEQEQIIQQLKDSNETLETTKKMLLDERQRLENVLKQRQEQNDQNLQEAVEHERQVGQEELERQKKKYEEEIQVLSMQINKLGKKLNIERKKCQEKTVLYNQLSDETRDQIQKLNAEKQELADQLDEKSRLDKKVTRLERKLNKERETNQHLTEEMSRISIGESPSKASFTSVSMQKSPRTSRMDSQIPGSPRTPTRLSQTGGANNTTNATAAATARSRYELDSFIQQLGNELQRFLGQTIQWNRARVVETVKSVIDRIKEVERETQGRNTNAARLSHLQSQWVQWADNLLAEFGRGYRPGMTEFEMRAKISDLVSCTNKKLIDIIENLRQQKALIAEGLPEKSDEENDQKKPKFADLARASLFLALAATNSGSKKGQNQRSVVAKHDKTKTTTSLSFV